MLDTFTGWMLTYGAILLALAVLAYDIRNVFRRGTARRRGVDVNELEVARSADDNLFRANNHR